VTAPGAAAGGPDGASGAAAVGADGAGTVRRRGGRPYAVVVLLLLAGALGVVAIPTWVTTSARTALRGVIEVAVSGTQAAPAVAAVALMLLAAAAAVGLVGRVGRWVVVAVVALGGAVVVSSSVAVVADPAVPAAAVVRATTGVARLAGPATLTAAPYVAIGLGAAVLLAAGWLAATSAAWARPSRRHEVAGAAGPDDDRSAWDALSRGDDPT